MNHTPGPWKGSRVGDTGLRVTGARQRFVFHVSGIDMSEDRSKTDVALVLAVPEMANMLRQAQIALAFYREWMTSHFTIDQYSYPFGIDVEESIKALLAKIEGETP